MKKEHLILLVLLVVGFFLYSTFYSNYARRSDIRDLIEDELIVEFNTVRSYLDGDSEYSRYEASEAFDTIEKELNKLY